MEQSMMEKEVEGYLLKEEGAAFPKKAIVACQGVQGAYSQITAKRLFPEGTFIYFNNFAAVVKAVREGMCEYGVLPIENNTYGSVKAVYQLLDGGDFHIVRGYRLKIDHQLLAKEGTKLGDITTIYSHEQALGQCGEFLHSLGRGVKAVPYYNTAISARHAAESSDPYCAAIASPECADIYGLKILRRHVADNDQNFTRFLCIASRKVVYPGADRISIILTLPHRPGALAHVLSKFAEQNINLLKIESSPIAGRDFEFEFYLDIEASVRDRGTREMLAELKEDCPTFQYLGNYQELS